MAESDTPVQEMIGLLKEVRDGLAERPTTDKEAIKEAIKELAPQIQGNGEGPGARANRADAERAEEEREKALKDAGKPARGVRQILTSKARNDAEAEIQRAHDRVYLASVILGAQARQANRGFDVRETNLYREFEDLVGKALSTTSAGEGEEFVYPGYSTQMIERLYLPRLAIGQFRQIPIARNGEKWLVSKGTGYAELIPEDSSENPQLIEDTTPGTRTVQFNCAVLGSSIPLTKVFDEDSIVNAYDWLESEAIVQIQRSLESALFNGDTAATHMDAVVTAAMQRDRRRAWDGLRKLAKAPASDTEVDLATFSAANVAKLPAKCGIYGVNPADGIFFISPTASLKAVGDATNWAAFQTMDKIGTQALNINGQIGQLYGRPVVVSAELPETCVQGASVNAGTGARAVMAYANTRGYAYGLLREVTVETEYTARAQRTYIVTTTRSSFQAWYDPTTEKNVAVGYNIDCS